MRSVFVVASLVALAALIGGCIETKQDYTLNPDGSGKVVFEVTVGESPLNMMGQEGDKPDPEVQARRMVKSLIDGSQGVDAWADVKYARTDDGRTRVSGTAYFKDFAKLKFQMASMEGLTFTKDDKGGMVLALQQKDEGKPPAAVPAPIPEDQMPARLEAERAKYQQIRIMMEAVMAKLKFDLGFLLPGTLTEVSNFRKEPSGTVRIVLEGAKMLEVMDKLMADDAYVRQAMVSGTGIGPGPRMDDNVREMLFGAKGPIRACVTGPFQPRFAYDAEVAAAKTNYPAMIQRLGLDKLPPPEAPTMPPGFGLPPGMKGTPPAPAPDKTR